MKKVVGLFFLVAFFAGSSFAQSWVQSTKLKSAEHGTEHGNGGDFTEQDIYLAINEIGLDLSELKKIDFGISGSEVLSEFKKGQFHVVVTTLVVLDRTGKKRDAINFSPNEINDSELARYKISPSLRDHRIIVVNETQWSRRLASNRTIKNLTTHELWGAMGSKDIGYAQTSAYLAKVEEISRNPTAWLCRAMCFTTDKMMPSQMDYISVTGFGANKASAFASMRSQCTGILSRGMPPAAVENSVRYADQVCYFNVP